MNVLIVYGHPNPQSFNHALLETFLEGLKEAGHTCEVSDLYGGGFDALFKSPDFAQFTGGEMPADILAEQKKVSGADAMVFIYPVWWWAAPAVVKGWYDRVLSMGFAYGLDEKGDVKPLLKHKKVVIITTTMGEAPMYQGMGLEDAMKVIDGATFTAMCGIQDVQHVFLFAAATDADARKGHLEQVKALGKDF